MKNNIQFIIKPRTANIGVAVKRILPWVKKRMVGPFIFLDELGPSILVGPNEAVDVRPHPHIGLSTLTYLFEGKLVHRDSLGVEQVIVPGEVNWMTAGQGISHSEREPQEVRVHERNLHGLQFWIALPLEHENDEPSFRHYSKEEIPLVENDSLKMTIIAGTAFDKNSELKTYSPTTFLLGNAHKTGTLNFKHVQGQEHAVYLVKGSLKVAGQVINEHEMVVFEMNSDIEVEYEAGSLFAIIGGEPFPEPRYIFWNFVSSSKEKIEEAKRAWKDRSFPQVPGERDFIPLPGDKSAVVDYP
ncbi:MAG TPA: pirin family protein [Bacteriovoracaceae bacterium]|nr:pirin family protein [Bacteriovoracaceae bacterium]